MGPSADNIYDLQDLFTSDELVNHKLLTLELEFNSSIIVGYIQIIKHFLKLNMAAFIDFKRYLYSLTT
jgi:hypothetical protein